MDQADCLAEGSRAAGKMTVSDGSNEQCSHHWLTWMLKLWCILWMGYQFSRGYVAVTGKNILTMTFISHLQLATVKQVNIEQLYSVSQKKSPPGDLTFFHFFTNGWEFVIDFFTHLLNVAIFVRLQIFIQLSPILTKLCHIKRDYPIHIICAKCPKSAKMLAFRRLRKSLIALLIVVCGKSL